MLVSVHSSIYLTLSRVLPLQFSLLMAISVSRFITNVFFYDVFNVKKQKSFVQSLTRQKIKE